MIRLIRLLEWRNQLKRYMKEGRAVPLFFSAYGAMALCKIVRLGWTQVEVEHLPDEFSEHGTERHLLDIEDLALAVTRNEGSMKVALARQLPELADLELDPDGADAPDDSEDYEEVSDEELLELSPEELRELYESGDLQLPPGVTFEQFLASIDFDED